MQGFSEVMDMLADEIVELVEVKELPSEAVEWLQRMTEYNVKGGKMNRGITVVSVVDAFAKSRNETMDNNLFVQSSILGCCIEWLQAFFLVADDVMDDSVTRRGKPCWFRNNDVKLIAINDSFILESYVFKILERHFRHLPIYVDLVDLFHQVTFKTEMGQLLDLTSQPLDKPVDLNRFTLERYRLIVKYKTAYYSFYLPVAIGMIVSGYGDKQTLKIAEKICLMMGEYFQIQDDFLDCFGNPEHIGKIGTDIQDNKCSWLVVQALARANPQQRELLTSNYGKHDERSVQIVKDLYREMDMPGIFQSYEDESYVEINRQIDLVPQLPRQVFDSLLQKIYKRSK